MTSKLDEKKYPKFSVGHEIKSWNCTILKNYLNADFYIFDFLSQNFKFLSHDC